MSCFHDFEILQSDASAHVEHCKRCKDKFIYPLDKRGNIDDRRYLEDHKHDYMHPGMREMREEKLKMKYKAFPRLRSKKI